MILVGLIIQRPEIALLGLIGAIGSIALISGREAQNRHASYSDDEISPDSRTLLRPVKKLADDIEAIITANRDSQTVQIVGQEARNEATHLLEQVRKSLVARDKLKKSLRGRYEAEKEIGEAKMRLEFADEAEKAALQSTIDARTLELTHYTEVEEALKKIEIGVNQAEAALAEMKARLSVTAAAGALAQGEGDDLRDTIGRMKALSAGYDEVDQLVNG